MDAYNGNFRLYSLDTNGAIHAITMPYNKNGTLATVEEVNSAISGVEKNLSHGRQIGSYENEVCYGVTGFITGSGKEAQITIPMCLKAEVNSIQIRTLKCAIRLISGSYLGGVLDSDLTSYITNVTLFRAQGIIRIALKKESGWGATNNTPFAGVCTMSYSTTA